MSSSSLSLGSALTVNGSGLGTGIDVTSMVDQEMSLLREPEKPLLNEQTTLSSQSTVLSALESGLSTLQTDVQAFTDINGQFNTKTTTSSDPTQLTASADPTANVGTHSIVVTSLATTSSYVTDQPLASGDTTFARGSFSITVGQSAPVTVTVDSTDDTLNTLAAAINNQNIGVTASVITDANGARLSLLSNTSGKAGDITIDPAQNPNGPTDPNANTTGLTFDKEVTGKNAALTVDGISVSSSSNTVSGVIPGVTLSLVTADPSVPVTLTVSPDTEAMTSAINSFVSDYNTLIEAINNQFTYDPATDSTPPPLLGDSGLELIQQQLYSAAGFSVGGNSGIVNLQSLGVSMNDDGTLTVDSSTLSSTLASQSSAVLNFFQGGTSSWGDNFNTNLYQMTNPLSGALNVELASNSQQQNDITDQINDFEARLSVQQQQLIDEYSTINTTLETLPTTLAQIKAQLGD
jgi:flagellar hook-associated protein 2